MRNLLRALHVEERPIASLLPARRNPRTHSPTQLTQLAASIRQFGFTTPILVDEDGRILAGHGRVDAAKQVGLTHVPTICLADLTEAQNARISSRIINWRNRRGGIASYWRWSFRNCRR